jgi:uncharacterized protein (UPF0212 family)
MVRESLSLNLPIFFATEEQAAPRLARHLIGKVLFDADAQPTRVALPDTRVP